MLNHLVGVVKSLMIHDVVCFCFLVLAVERMALWQGTMLYQIYNQQVKQSDDFSYLLQKLLCLKFSCLIIVDVDKSNSQHAASGINRNRVNLSASGNLR